MNEWSFRSVLPLVNSDIEVIGKYIDNDTKIECICKKCGEHFYMTPNKLINKGTHCARRKYGNPEPLYCIGGGRYVSKLDKIWRTYYNHDFDFITGFDFDNLTVSVKCKQCNKIININVLSENNKVKHVCHVKTGSTSKKMSTKYKKYHFFDCNTQKEIFCTPKELAAYAGKESGYVYLSEIKSKSWFKKRFKIMTADKKTRIQNRNKHYEKRLTYFKKKCKKDFEPLGEFYRPRTLPCCDCEICIKEGDTDKLYYTFDEFNDYVKEKNISIDTLTEFVDNTTSIVCKCKECGYVFERKPKELFDGTFCPNCKSSKGEQIIASFLMKNSIEFEREKTFDGLRSKRNLRFDFYLKQYNAVIEFDGLQHYKPTMFFANTYEEAKKNYNELHKRDLKKNRFCKDNNISMLRVKYDDKDIDSTLFKFISDLKDRNNNICTTTIKTSS